ncbi:copper homeostasis membrane protein CopD [Sphingomonas sp.]|uniref:copper homeostasis membrane protein CopD n=1 Tax=Sphingomonas sp. TaxID=28214 RepID=UPI002EDB5CC4
MDWAGIGIRFALYLDLMLATGLAVFAIANSRAAAGLTVRTLVVVLGLLGLLLSVCGLLLLAAGMLGLSVAEVDVETLQMVLSGTSVGAAWTMRMAALVVATGAAFLIGRASGALPVCASALVIAVATLAWSGHGAMNEGTAGWLHLVADIAHLLAAAMWTGALFALVLLVARPVQRVDAAHLELTQGALHGFATMGTIIVAVIVVTGLANILLVVGPAAFPPLPFTLYGQLLLAKLALFVVMLALAAANRFRLTPTLSVAMADGDHRRAMAALRRSLAVETGCAVAILALVAWLGTLEPTGG